MYMGSFFMFPQTKISVFPEEFVLFYFSNYILVQMRKEYNKLAAKWHGFKSVMLQTNAAQ